MKDVYHTAYGSVRTVPHTVAFDTLPGLLSALTSRS